MLNATGTVSALGDSAVLIPGVAKQSIWVSAARIQNEAPTTQTVIVKSGVGGTAEERVYCPNPGDGYDRVYDDSREFQLAIGMGLVLNLSAATQVGYSFQYEYR